MTPAKLPFGIGERVAIHALYCDIVPGKFCEEVRLRGTIAGGERRTIYLGPTAEALSALHSGGALASLDNLPSLAPGAPGAEIQLAQRDLVLERVAVPNTRRSRLVVQLAEAPRPNGAHAATTSAEPAGASSSDPCAAKRAAIVTAFGTALDTVIAEYAPRFVAQHITLSDDVIYRCAFTLFAAWRDAGCA